MQVVPATWTGFGRFVAICPECQSSDRFTRLVKQKKIVSAKPAKAAKESTEAATAVAEPEAPRVVSPGVKIRHRKSGEVLLELETKTLTEASLVGAALSNADLHGTGLTGADLHNADLRLADLAGADLRNVDLRNANLRGADLRSTDLRGARLQRADLRFALYDEQTRWPEGFDTVASGAQRQGR
ncbi:MAG: pentapeptide repeat-containing protein [Armatimonadota bacterium]